ncbi:hypothetical protein R1sor_007746 [Riccia sorocarpa]|uniref:Uncharacterized protein n=1 Tax=Riccia sorocarpa TaxID=122646 RepID=A0ABD3HRC0_9MARC
MGMIALERGDSQLQLHIQGVLSIKANSTRSLKADISVAIGWSSNASVGAGICIKILKERAVLIVRNVSKVPIEASIGSNTPQLLAGDDTMWAVYPSLKWLCSTGIKHKRAERLWHASINPQEAIVYDIDMVFFGSSPTKRYWRYSYPAELMISDALMEQTQKEVANMKTKLEKLQDPELQHKVEIKQEPTTPKNEAMEVNPAERIDVVHVDQLKLA